MKTFINTLFFIIVSYSFCIAQGLSQMSGTVKKITLTKTGYFAYIKMNGDDRIIRASINKNDLQYPASYTVFKEGDNVEVIGINSYKNEKQWDDGDEEYRMAVKHFGFLQTSEIMKKIIAAPLNKDSVELENLVTFSTFDDGKNKPAPDINFTLRITNLSDRLIPALSHANNSILYNGENLTSIYINGEQTGLSIYNGVGFLNETLNKGNSSEDAESWVLTPTSGVYTYGDIITVQWKYMGIWSDKVTVDIKNRKIIK